MNVTRDMYKIKIILSTIKTLPLIMTLVHTSEYIIILSIIIARRMCLPTHLLTWHTHFVQDSLAMSIINIIFLY